MAYFDSPERSFALVLAFAAAAVLLLVQEVRPAPRATMRFACALYVGLAIGCLAGGALTIALVMIVSALAPPMLALSVATAFGQPPTPALAALAFAGALLLGLGAAFGDIPALAFAPLALSALVLLATGFRHRKDNRAAALRAAATGLALIAAGSAYVAGGARAIAALILFYAAALLGAALTVARVLRGTQPHVPDWDRARKFRAFIRR